MENKYNVDDILAEIKRRKLRERAAESSQSKPQPQTVSRQKSEFKPSFELEQELMSEPDLGYEPEPKPAPRPAPKPEPRPAPKPETRPAPIPEPRPEPMARPIRINPESFVPPGDPRRKDFAKVWRETEAESDEFVPVENKRTAPRANPLEFDGEVQSITDRAKRRSSRSPGLFQGNPLLQQFDFHTEELDEPDETHIDEGFSLKSNDTRVLPSLSAVRGISQEREVPKKADFGKFALKPDDGYYDEPPEDDGIPEGSVIDYSEYNSTSDRKDVQTDIAHVKLWLFIRISLTLALTAVLFVLTLAGKYSAIPLPEFMWPEEPATIRIYLIVCTAITILIAVINSSAVGGGLIGLFKMHSNSDTLSAFAIIAAVGQGVAVVANPALAEPGALNLYFCVAAFAMLFNALGKMTMITRILSNFRIISSHQPKKAVVAVNSERFCREFIKDSPRCPTIVHGVDAGFFSDFLGLSYSDKYDVGVNRAVAPVCLAGALLVGVITNLLTGNSFSAISAATAILCVCATLSSTFIENVPLSKLAKRLTPQEGMVSGTKAVEDFCDVRAIVLNENELFPQGNVQLHGIKAFSQNRIDEAIIDAASVLCDINGALGPVFLDMIGGNKKLLKKADNIVYENAMGISAWVDSRRVLIGNRKLMMNHGIQLPSEAATAKYTNEAEPLFLSNSGEATAMFTVSYHVDEELAISLDYMAARNTVLIMHTTDANITAEKISELYGYPPELIRILPAELHDEYKEMTEPRDREIAEIAYTGKAATMINALLACMSARGSILSATVIQLVQIVLGYALVTLLAFMGSIGTLDVLKIFAYQIFWFAAIFIIQKVRQG